MGVGRPFGLLECRVHLLREGLASQLDSRGGDWDETLTLQLSIQSLKTSQLKMFSNGLGVGWNTISLYCPATSPKSTHGLHPCPP